MSDKETERYRDLLTTVNYPGFSRDIVSLRLIRDIAVHGTTVTVTLDTTDKNPQTRTQLEKDINGALSRAEGVEKVVVRFELPPPKPLPVAGQSAAPTAAGASPASEAASEAMPTLARRVIGVASGKGGVGKSTVSVNLAIALAQRGRRVGFLDADVHGPSAPLMFGLEGKRPNKSDTEGRPLPIEAYGVRVMSMGFFVERDKAVIWRGPIVGNFIKQLLTDVAWGELDDLIIDLPPGTGDAQLSLCQTIQLDGAVVVSTPNELALIDALKAVQMFEQVKVPVLGIVENMSYFTCPHCDEKTEIFSHGGARAVAGERSIPFLGEIPIDPEMVTGADRGRPVVAAAPEGSIAKAFSSLADAVASDEAGQSEDEIDSGGLGSFFRRFGGKAQDSTS